MRMWCGVVWCGVVCRRKNQQTGSSLKQAGEAKVYQLVISLCKLIQEDITFDLNLKVSNQPVTCVCVCVCQSL